MNTVGCSIVLRYRFNRESSCIKFGLEETF